MKGKVNFKIVALCVILSAMLLIPTLVQAKDSEEQFKERRMQMILGLKLAPDKEKAMLGVEDKYAKDREEIVTDMRKANADLEEALKAANPDKAKIKELASAITAGQNKMFASFKSQRDEEMALMTPVEQGKYLLQLYRNQSSLSFGGSRSD
jgi:Spy/CpxP family protein refolding chaperone